MLFHSQAFILLFLPLVIAAFHASARRPVLREWLLIAASIGFYAWWDVRFVPLILGQTIVSWLVAATLPAAWRRYTLPTVIAANLAVLGWFKYAGFLAGTLEALLGAPLPDPSPILPIGISFYTFQIISYLADREALQAPAYGFRRFMLYILFFPQLIAGPIVRHHEFMPQLALDPLRDGVAERISRGAMLFILGLAKKVLLADQLARIADPVFFQASAGGAVAAADAWLAGVAFTLQIYFDFSGYTDMALGIALMMGISLPFNFNAPYHATSLRDLWRRWHITLSRFLRDYVYIPLGGSRHGRARHAFAAMATMTLCGLWHGAGWTFVAWGALHGAGLLVNHAWQRTGVRLPALAGWLLTMLFWAGAMVIFRSPDFATAGTMFAGLAGISEAAPVAPTDKTVILAIAAAVACLGPTSQEVIGRSLRPNRAVAAAAALVLGFIVLEVGKGQPVNFIYFQF